MSEEEYQLANGGKCPKCDEPLEVRANMLHFRGQDFPCSVCPKCQSLWTDGDAGWSKFIKAAGGVDPFTGEKIEL